MHARFGNTTLLLMPGYTGEYFATKLVSVNAENRNKGLPAIYGTVILNDGVTGKPLAMLEGSSLTAHRTAAVSAVGIRHTVREDISTAGLIGAGMQGYHQLLYACTIKPVKTARIFDFDKKTVAGFIEKIGKALPEITFIPAASSREIVEHTELVITATTSARPVLPDDTDMLKGKHFVAVGSYTPAMQELPPSLFDLLDQIIVDTQHAAAESGDVINPVKNGQIKPGNIVPVSEIIIEKRTLSQNKTTLFKSVGSALFDLAAAKYLYQTATEEKNPGIFVDMD
jgi:ornithine cyclodeaminase